MRVSSLERSWIAGFFEGEGCVGNHKINLYRGSKKYCYRRLSVMICQKDKRVIVWIKNKLNYGIVYKTIKQGINKITMWRWKVSDKQARRFLTWILPRLKTPIKIRKVSKALQFDKKFVKER